MTPKTHFDYEWAVLNELWFLEDWLIQEWAWLYNVGVWTRNGGWQ